MLETKSSVRKIKKHSIAVEYLRMTVCRSLHRERERERDREAQKTFLFHKAIIQHPTLQKGYKVTIYSDRLRATTLYANYINGQNGIV
jgi:hypothetical protein